MPLCCFGFVGDHHEADAGPAPLPHRSSDQETQGAAAAALSQAASEKERSGEAGHSQQAHVSSGLDPSPFAGQLDLLLPASSSARGSRVPPGPPASASPPRASDPTASTRPKTRAPSSSAADAPTSASGANARAVSLDGPAPTSSSKANAAAAASGPTGAQGDELFQLAAAYGPDARRDNAYPGGASVAGVAAPTPFRATVSVGGQARAGAQAAAGGMGTSTTGTPEPGSGASAAASPAAAGADSLSVPRLLLKVRAPESPLATAGSSTNSSLNGAKTPGAGAGGGMSPVPTPLSGRADTTGRMVAEIAAGIKAASQQAQQRARQTRPPGPLSPGRGPLSPSEAAAAHVRSLCSAALFSVADGALFPAVAAAAAQQQQQPARAPVAVAVSKRAPGPRMTSAPLPDVGGGNSPHAPVAVPAVAAASATGPASALVDSFDREYQRSSSRNTGAQHPEGASGARWDVLFNKVSSAVASAASNSSNIQRSQTHGHNVQQPRPSPASTWSSVGVQGFPMQRCLTERASAATPPANAAAAAFGASPSGGAKGPSPTGEPVLA